MNYLRLRRLIWVVATLAFLLSAGALVFVLRLTWNESKGADFQGAGAMATVIPSFAGALLAAISIYALLKAEDPVAQVSEQVLLSAQRLRSLYDSWIGTVALAYKYGRFEELKILLEATGDIATDHLYNRHVLSVLGAKYEKQDAKQSVHHAASRLLLAIHLIRTSSPGTDPAKLTLPTGENVLGVFLQALHKLLDDISALPPAEIVRNLIAQGDGSVMKPVLDEIMTKSQVPKWWG